MSSRMNNSQAYSSIEMNEMEVKQQIIHSRGDGNKKRTKMGDSETEDEDQR